MANEGLGIAFLLLAIIVTLATISLSLNRIANALERKGEPEP